ncbi:MAG: hypothetical protein K2P85_03110 [Flavobacteriaceae bacterium]|nr:hypothetical protein [Flavobacteriaceae bacterium]
MNTEETTKGAVSEKTATPEQLAAWKTQYGEFFGIVIEDKVCYLKKPDRKALSFASQVGSDPMKFNEVILKNCWIGGDEEILTDDSLFLAASSKLDQVIEFKKAELVKY